MVFSLFFCRLPVLCLIYVQICILCHVTQGYFCISIHVQARMCRVVNSKLILQRKSKRIRCSTNLRYASKMLSQKGDENGDFCVVNDISSPNKMENDHRWTERMHNMLLFFWFFFAFEWENEVAEILSERRKCRVCFLWVIFQCAPQP